MNTNNDVILSVDKVSKKFCRDLRKSMIYGAIDLSRNIAGIRQRRDSLRPKEFWALNNVSLEVRRGDTVGVVGSNGSGKSTLLRLIAGIFPPDKGEIKIRGKVGALIALGAGFHPHMTGLENIYLNATLLGMSRKEIDQKLGQIVDFAEIGDFLEAPVSTYSSGMTVRLGFSIAAHCEPELLIVDEVLAVGDLAFALKCYRKMSEYRLNGGSTLMVSHNNQLIRNVCKSAVWLDKGIVRSQGSVHKVCDEYELAMTQNLSISEQGKAMDYDPSSKVSMIEILDKGHKGRSTFEVGELLNIRIHYDSIRKIEKPIFSVAIETLENQVVVSNFTHFDGKDVASISGKGYVDFIIPRLSLKRGKYLCTVTFADKDLNHIISWHERTKDFHVSGGPVSYGLFNPFPDWVIK